MSVNVTITGIDELRAALRQLPETLAHEASVYVERAADTAANQIRATYGQHRKTGDLADKVSVKTLSTGSAATAVQVRSGSRLAFIFETGTQARHYVTVGGRRHLTGRMPPFHAFVPPVVRARRQMNEQLIDLLRRQGLVVTGAV